jgi:hypothetical protein
MPRHVGIPPGAMSEMCSANSSSVGTTGFALPFLLQEIWLHTVNF